jgi:hypothetical protein
MSDIRKGLVRAALNKSVALIDYNIHDDFHKRYEFKQQTILADNSLTEEEKTEAKKEENDQETKKAETEQVKKEDTVQETKKEDECRRREIELKP